VSAASFNHGDRSIVNTVSRNGADPNAWNYCFVMLDSVGDQRGKQGLVWRCGQFFVIHLASLGVINGTVGVAVLEKYLPSISGSPEQHVICGTRGGPNIVDCRYLSSASRIALFLVYLLAPWLHR
jgi:hypothetical protein